ncbi:MAG TPA: hypothetical protein VGG72_25595 [Bryobacteraceae bacterium]|jgi:hypothetical protein
MTYTKSTKASSAGQSSSSSASASATATSSPCGCGCGCNHHGTPDTGCCKLTCFERPQYFCGQLLSDADLTLEETYFREKNKLYHRTLDGFGVVCGLRMRCDGNCKGKITIGDGYAIDCCGNDLVVCEPRSFDVIGELRKKKWLMEMPQEPCREERDREYERDCITRQCFYIGICYDEVASNYVAPYTTDCSPGPGPCQPTRIREGVRFEIYDKLPVRPNPLTEIEKRIERCFCVFREGQFAKGLQLLAPRILEILRCRDEREERKEEQREERNRETHTFQELRALFLHQLRICPDQYNCNLEQEVYELRPPREREGSTALESFTRLFELIQKYVFSCVLAEFAFLCPEPPDNCCVLIGSVEVENGKLTRVINYPRWYLWCFANFFEVLVYTVANEAACDRAQPEQTPIRDEPRKPRREGCCPGFEVDVCEFLSLFVAENRAPEYAARALPTALKAMQRAMIDGFDFTKPNGVATAAFNGMSIDTAKKLAETLHFKLEALGESGAGAQDLFSAITENGILRRGGQLAYESEGERITTAMRPMGAPSSAVGPYSVEAISELVARLKKCEDEIKDLRGNQNPEGGQRG